MLERTTDAEWLNGVATHPEVLPWLGGPAFDLGPLLALETTYALRGEHGAFLFLKVEPGVYSVHSLFLPTKGSEACRLVRDALRFMFTETDCELVETFVPEPNRAAASLARLAHMQVVFRRERAWPINGGPDAITHLALTVERWAACDPVARRRGEAFHEELEGAKNAAGSALVTHDDDAAHDHFVGAALLMAEGGQPRKGVWLYRRFARQAGYVPAHLVSDSPAIIDVGDAIVEATRAGLRFLTIRGTPESMEAA